MNNNWKLDLHKNRDKIAIGAGIIIVLIALVCVIVLLLNNDGQNDLFTPKTEYANYYATVEGNSVVLYNAAGNKIDEIKHDKIVYPNHLGDEMIIYADGKIYKVTAYEKPKTTANSSTVLKEELLLDYETKSIVEFIWNDQYLVFKRENGSLEVYDRINKKSIYLDKLPLFDEFIIADKYIIYTIDDTISSINIETKETTTIDVGAKTYGFSVNNGKVIAFNQFGNGNNLTSIFVLNPSDLKIEALVTESSKNVFLVKSDSAHFVKDESKIIITEVGTDGKFSSITMNTKSGEKEYTDSNALICKNYLYTNKDNVLVIISLKNKLVQKTINISGEYFCPLYIEAA